MCALAKKPRPLEYEGDILANLDWGGLTLPEEDLENIALGNDPYNKNMAIGLPDSEVKDQENWHGSPAEFDPVLMTRQLIDIVPNPWDAHALTLRISDFFTKRDGRERTAANFVFIIEESRKLLAAARDKMAESYFCSQVEKGIFELLLFSGEGEWKIPSSVALRSERKMNRQDPLQRSLFDYVPDEDMNEYEKAVAFYLDKQSHLLWWYRNQTYSGYKLQGWKRNRIAPDFITASDNGKGDMKEVRVFETKGMHLKNEDTDYKKSLLHICDTLCREKGQKRNWNELGLEFADHQFRFHLVFEDDWESAMNRIFADSTAE